METEQENDKNDQKDKKRISSGIVAIFIALISALSSIAVAYISIYPKISSVQERQNVSDSAVSKIISEILIKDKILLYKDLPVGTILQSVLKFDDFSKVVNQPPSTSWNSGDRSFTWAPADGRTVAGSEYAKVTSQIKLIDLRGVFVRGLNQFDSNEQNELVENQADPDGLRIVGKLQLDGLKKHQHNIKLKDGNNNDGDGDCYDTSRGEHDSHTITTQGNEDGIEETRPKNIALYFYVKIN